jgi:hypothetical protein
MSLVPFPLRKGPFLFRAPKKPRRSETMITETEARDLIDDLFEEEALVIGGLVAVHEIDDDLVWRLMKNLDVIRGRFMRRLEERGGGEEAPARRPSLDPHPAIEDFLMNLGRA